MNFYERLFIYEDRKILHIPEDYKKVYELYKRIRDVFKSTNNIQEILCPDLVKVVLEDDFDQRLKRSFGKNKKVRPEILFDGYRKDTEVEDNKENTAQSDEDLDL